MRVPALASPGLWIAVALLPILGACGVLTVPGGADSGGRSDGGVDGGGVVVEAKLSSLYGDYLKECQRCHSPSGPGRTSDTEKTLDFSTAATAHATLTTGKAGGLKGNAAGCNDVPFVAAKAEQSLLLAVLDQDTRKSFDLALFANCDEAAISDMTVRVGRAPSPAFVVALKKWLVDGAPNN